MLAYPIMTTALQTFGSHSLSVSTLSAYIDWVNKIPMLTDDEELELATRLRDKQDLEAARRLVLSHLRLVVKMARGYSGYGLSQEDLIQEGNIGLMKAVKRFNPEHGVRLVSFAIHWIRAEMHEFVIKNWRIVKIATTKAQRKLFFNLRKMSKKLGWLSNQEVKVIAEELKVPEKEVRVMESRLSNYDESFDGYDDDTDSNFGSWASPANYLEDQSQSPEKSLMDTDWSDRQIEQLEVGLAKLDDRSRDILQKRWLDDKKQTLHELADTYQVSAERIRQLEKNAMTKLQKAFA